MKMMKGFEPISARWQREGRLGPTTMARLEEAKAGRLIDVDEWREMRANSYDRYLLIRFLTDEALLVDARNTLDNCVLLRVPALTYEDAMAGQVGEELYKRLKAKTP